MKTNLTKRDVVVLAACIVFVFANLGAIGNGGRKRAKAMLCLSNLHQWGEYFQAYLEDNDGYFFKGLQFNGPPEGHWYWDLLPYYGHNPDLRLCPEATKLIAGGNGSWHDPHSAWGKFGIRPLDNQSWGTRWVDGFYGSYGINPWVNDQAPGIENDVPVGAKGYWRTVNVKGVNRIPVFFGCLWYQIWPGPFPDDDPPATEYASGMGMRQACLDRHNGAVNMLFMDFSARKVGLKEPWTLKWHQVFDTEGEWTTAGGVQPEDWPEWMRKYKDY